VKVLISGASGLVGSALMGALRSEGHVGLRLARPGTPLKTGDIRWDPATGELDATSAEDADAVVNLAGASIADGRWNHQRKQLLRSSRIGSTHSLVDGLAKLRQAPKIFISASAIGYYGDRAGELLTETGAPGQGFLADLARDWESAAVDAERRLGARTVLLRFGIILSPRGGALAKMLPPFKMGVGGKLGSGSQWMSWVTQDEVTSIILFALNEDGLRGPVNVVSPNPVQNGEFTRILARVLHRPAVFPVPVFALRAIFGEMADALLLSSQRIVPEALTSHGYMFQHPQLDAALNSILRERRGG
jgi:uncharacterized protein